MTIKINFHDFLPLFESLLGEAITIQEQSLTPKGKKLTSQLKALQKAVDTLTPSKFEQELEKKYPVVLADIIFEKPFLGNTITDMHIIAKKQKKEVKIRDEESEREEEDRLGVPGYVKQV